MEDVFGFDKENELKNAKEILIRTSTGQQSKIGGQFMQKCGKKRFKKKPLSRRRVA